MRKVYRILRDISYAADHPFRSVENNERPYGFQCAVAVDKPFRDFINNVSWPGSMKLLPAYSEDEQRDSDGSPDTR